MSPREGLIVGTVLCVGGVVYLAVAVNLISALLAAATIGIYLFAYTPLKRISTTNTLVGAIPGALPPLIGWAAARNDLALPAWTFFAILFFWQLPHFFAIGWMTVRIMCAPVSSCSPVAIWKASVPDGRAFSSRCFCSSPASHRLV